MVAVDQSPQNVGGVSAGWLFDVIKLLISFCCLYCYDGCFWWYFNRMVSHDLKKSRFIPTPGQIELAIYGNDVMDLTSSGLRSI